MKKKFKIFALPSHATKERTSGVDFLRIIQPMKYLGKNPKFEVTVWEIENDMTWPDIAREYDAVYFSYLNNPWGFAAMGAMFRKYKKKIIMDFDDDLWDIKQDNVVYETYKRGSEGIRNINAIGHEVDYVTCTGNYLRNSIGYNIGKDLDLIEVFPNYIDLTLYDYIAKPKDTTNINIGHFGSTTHFTSLQEEKFVSAMNRIMQDYPNVTFTTIGSFIGKFREMWGPRYINKFGDVDVYRWIKIVSRPLIDEIDFFVTPLTDDVYNRCKSSTKFNEVSSFKRPGVWQDIRQYQEVVDDGENGFLASSEKEWYEGMKALIESYTLRAKMAQSAYDKVRENYTIQSHVGEYADFFEKILLTK